MDVTSTRVDDVVAALVEVFGVALPGVQILDGPVPWESDADVVVVGIGNGTDVDSYRVRRDNYDLGGRSKEYGTVRCQAATWHGDDDFAPLRARVVGWLTSLEAAFRADQKLLGTCDRVMLGSARWYHLGGPSGAGLGADFDVDYEAFI